MTFSILTLFPDMFSGPFTQSIVKRAVEDKKISINFINIRDFAVDTYRTVDDRPFGGGKGMILKVDIVDKAIQKTRNSKFEIRNSKTKVILLDPRGETYNQQQAKRLAKKYDHIILVCGHYEGVDERIRSLVDATISIGDYVLTGGEIAAMAIVDSITRLLPGVLPEDVPSQESFEHGLEYPQYTRPQTYNNMSVPEILLSGNHKKIEDWKIKQANELTKKFRPDLLKGITE